MARVGPLGGDPDHASGHRAHCGCLALPGSGWATRSTTRVVGSFPVSLMISAAALSVILAPASISSYSISWISWIRWWKASGLAALGGGTRPDASL